LVQSYRRARIPWFLVLMALVVTAAVLLSPGYLVLRASEASKPLDALTSSVTLKALGRTVLLTVTVVLGGAAIGVPAAWLTARTDLPFRNVWTVLLALPLAVPTFIGGFVMVSAMAPHGMLQDLLEPLGVRELPSIYGFKGAWLTVTLLSYPYIFIPVRAALNRMDASLEEASRSLGKTARTTFLQVTLPQLRPAIAAGGILLSLYTLSEFGAVAMLRYDTLTPLVYIQYTSSFDRNAAAVLALPLLVLAGLVVALEGMSRGSARYDSATTRRKPPLQHLGRWRWPAALFCALPVVLGIGTPVAVVVYWLVKGISEGESTSLLGEAVVNSARVSLMAAVVTIVAALPIALLSVRHRNVFTGLLEKASYSGQAIPGITIALALVFFTANYLSAYYQTLSVLIFAYAVRFLPEALGATRSALVQVNPHTEEAARSLGSGQAGTFFRVTSPQMLPGMSAGALLVFLTVMKELPITLLLSPIAFDTLTTQVWSATSEAFFTHAALPALVLVLISGFAVLLMLRREGIND
jgi:iron(III) transport system permease protein